MEDIDKNLTTKRSFQPAVRLCVLSSQTGPHTPNRSLPAPTMLPCHTKCSGETTHKIRRATASQGSVGVGGEGDGLEKGRLSSVIADSPYPAKKVGAPQRTLPCAMEASSLQPRPSLSGHCLVPEALADIPPEWLGWAMKTEKFHPEVLPAQWKRCGASWADQPALFSPTPASEALALALAEPGERRVPEPGLLPSEGGHFWTLRSQQLCQHSQGWSVSCVSELWAQPSLVYATWEALGGLLSALLKALEFCWVVCLQ